MPKVLRRKVVERFDPDEDFSDVDGDLINEFALVNDKDVDGRPDAYHYVWAHNSPDDIARFRGSQLGYELVRHTGDKDEVAPRMSKGFKDGDVYTRHDHVLMRCDRKLWEKRQRYERKKQREAADRLHRQRQKDSVAGQHRAEWTAVNAG